MKKIRAFKRDAYIGIRLPDDDKRRLTEAARKKRRDTSNLALEFIVEGVRKVEAELQKQPVLS
jgi:predicted transcriptional regulator